MKITKWKLFFAWQYEEEEVWLNGMAARGYAMTSYFLFRYTFEKTQPGEFIYRIEFLKSLPSAPDSAAYLAFLNENGIAVVEQWQRWVYLRKRADEGDFELYSDMRSKIDHFSRVYKFLLFLSVFITGTALLNVSISISGGHALNLGMGILFCMFGTASIFGARNYNEKLKRLQDENILHE